MYSTLSCSYSFTGTIPPCYSSLSNLEILDLSKNAISGGFHRNFSCWRKLCRLDIHGNREFVAAIPQSFSQLTSLEYLDITGCSANLRISNKSFTDNVIVDESWWIPRDIQDFKDARAITAAITNMGNCGQCGETSGLDSIGKRHFQINSAPHKDNYESHEEILLRRFTDEDLHLEKEQALREEEEDSEIIPGDVGSFPEIPPMGPGTRPDLAKDSKIEVSKSITRLLYKCSHLGLLYTYYKG